MLKSPPEAFSRDTAASPSRRRSQTWRSFFIAPCASLRPCPWKGASWRAGVGRVRCAAVSTARPWSTEDPDGAQDDEDRFPVGRRGRLLRLLRRPLRREPFLRRRHRHRRAQGQRRAAPGPELGAVPRLGKRPLHRPVAAVFFGEPVLTIVVPGRAKREPGIPRLLNCRSRMVRRTRPGMTTTVLLHSARKSLFSAARRFPDV